MDTLGSPLEEARKRKGVSIREASEATKIRMEYLSQFESDDFDIPLPEIYQRGFVGIYARYLDEDPQVFSEEIKSRQNRLHAVSGRSDSRGSLGHMDLKSRRRPAPDSQGLSRAVSVDDGGPSSGGKPQWKIPSLKLPSLRSSTAPVGDEFEDFEESGEGPDRMFYLRVGLIVGIVTIAVVLLIVLIKLIAGGGEDKPAEINSDLNAGGGAPTEIVGSTEEGETSPPAAAANSEILIRAAGGPTWVQVERADNGELIGRVSLADGESRTFPANGEVQVLFTQGENLEVVRGGETFTPTRAGTGRFRVR